MNKIILTFFVFNFLPTFSGLTFNCFAQWVLQQSGTTNHLLDVEFINRNTGWACGDNGTIIKTTNGGLNWIAQNSGAPGKNLFGIHPVDENIVYCVGLDETILKTTNGGNNWIAIRNGPPMQGGSFFEVFFLNENTGWILRNNYILRTTNGALTFDSSYVIYTYLRDIYFKDPVNGVLCGDGDLIMKSTNGGVNWYKINIPLYNFGLPDFFKESFVGNIGWVVGRGGDQNLGKLVYRTTDFGSSWDTIARVPSPNNTENYCVFFPSLNTGWCGGSFGYVFKTTNSGFNWIQENSPSTNNFFIRSFYFYTDSVGWGVGGGGNIIYTTTGGSPVAVIHHENEIPAEFKLFQNYPNPFNSISKIKFQISKIERVMLQVFDVLGKQQAVLVNDELNPGTYEVEFDGTDFASGIYFYKMIADGTLIGTKKLILIK